MPSTLNPIRCILFILFLVSTNKGLQAKPTFRYLEINQNEIEVGTYQGNGIKKKDPTVFPLRNIDIKEVEEALFKNSSNSNNLKVLYYFHSLYGGVPIYHRNTVKKMHGLEELDVMVSVVWHTKGLSYKNSYQQAYETGKSIGGLVEHLLTDTQKNNMVMCHSMGNRIFQGAIGQAALRQGDIDLLILLGADLPVNIFEESFQPVADVTERIVLYVHEKDRLLKVSRKMHGEGRLGQDGLVGSGCINELDNLQRIDVTHSKGQAWIKLSNHIYFKRDPHVFQDIKWAIAEKEIQRNQYLTKLDGNKFLLN